MTAKQLAIQDIKDDLMQHSRCFIAYNQRLTPVINSLVKSYIKAQEAVSNIQTPYNMTYKTNAQLIARCTYIPQTGKVRFENFSHYYSSSSSK